MKKGALDKNETAFVLKKSKVDEGRKPPKKEKIRSEHVTGQEEMIGYVWIICCV